MTSDNAWASAIAQSIWNECIDNAENVGVDELAVRLDVVDRDRFLAATRFFRFALCVLVLLHEERTDPRLREVRALMEHRAATDGIRPDETRWAMNILLRLLNDENGGARWAHDWFETIGMNERNPASLMLFSLAWMDFYSTVRDAVARL